MPQLNLYMHGFVEICLMTTEVIFEYLNSNDIWYRL